MYRSTQPCIPLGSLNRLPALISWGTGGNVTSAGWQVTLCDPIWYVSSRSGEAVCELLYTRYLLTYRSHEENYDRMYANLRSILDNIWAVVRADCLVHS